ncbi:MAG: thiolase family protein [Chloroflexota bacterium]|nr:thiolase family protein [Chloroflexota bacterium]
MREVAIIGVGMHPFGRFDDKSYVDIGREATVAALKDAGIEWKQVQTAYCSCMYLPATSGVRVLSTLGRTGIPIVDVEAACASGGVGLKHAYLSVASGQCDIALALGVEKMPRGFMEPTAIYEDWEIKLGLAVNPMYWAMKARRHMELYGTNIFQIAKVAVKNHKNSIHNPYAMYHKEFSLEEIMNSRPVCDPITLLMICAPNEGAAAVILCPKEMASQYARKPVTVASTVHRVSLYPWFRCPAYQIPTQTDNPEVTELTARDAYREAGLGPEDLDVVELQDTDAFCEIEAYEGLGLCPTGEGGKLIEDGVTEMGGRLPTSVSGGLICKGEPVGASHLGQVAELTWQLRGEAGPRQVPGAKVALAHVVGAGGNCAVTILKR